MKTAAARMTLAGLTGLALVIALVLFVANAPLQYEAEEQWGAPGAFGLWAVTFTLVGYLITRERSENAIGWLLLGAGLAAALTQLGVVTVAIDGTPSWLARAADPLVGGFVPAVGLLLLAVLLFPNGRPPSPRWNWGVWYVAISTGVLFVATVALLARDGFTSDVGESDSWYTAIWIPWQLASLVLVAALVVRFRRSSGLEKQQLKWLVYAGALVAATAVGTEVMMPLLDVGSGVDRLGNVALSILPLFVPASMGIAILRYNLYDIDRVINRTVVYAAVVALLALVYVAGVFTLRELLPVEGDLAVAASTLAVAALFNPVRKRVQRFVDRRFYRSRYDALRIADDFAARLRDELDLEVLTDEFAAIVNQTMHPTFVTVRLRNGSRNDAGTLIG